MLLLAAADTIPLMLLGTAAMGGSQAAFMAIGNAMVQSLAPDGMRGRLTGLNQINVGGTMAGVNLVNGFAAGWFGASNVLWTLGLAFLIVAAASLAVGALRDIYRGASTAPAQAG